MHLGIDPSDRGFYWASTVFTGQKFRLLGFGGVKGNHAHIMKELLNALDTTQPDQVHYEKIGDWLSNPQRFPELARMAEVNGVIIATTFLRKIKANGVSVTDWRKQIGVRGKDQDAKVKGYMEMMLEQYPGRGSGYLNHHRDATGVSIGGYLLTSTKLSRS